MKVTNLRPRHDYVTLEPVKAPQEKLTNAGIVIPEMAQDKPTEGVVLAVGPGRQGEFAPVALKPGDRVFYNRYSAVPFELDGREVLLVRDADIIASVEVTES